jgi:uncharacterized protein YdhG (YjbR/CyaY superfamily)
VVAFASQKNYIALYGMPEVARRYSKELTGCSMGKGCNRFRSAKALDFDLIGRIAEGQS